MSWIVERESAIGPSAAYTGPMRTESHADRERDAWRAHGYQAPDDRIHARRQGQGQTVGAGRPVAVPDR